MIQKRHDKALATLAYRLGQLSVTPKTSRGDYEMDPGGKPQQSLPMLKELHSISEGGLEFHIVLAESIYFTDGTNERFVMWRDLPEELIKMLETRLASGEKLYRQIAELIKSTPASSYEAYWDQLE